MFRDFDIKYIKSIVKHRIRSNNSLDKIYLFGGVRQPIAHMPQTFSRDTYIGTEC